ncbi:MAG: hypothetical protein QNJ73_13645 [Gammaproteobacteria bacterium]|nr:hypothetical protein [Gammaproteobacteria bacterium]
MNIRIALSLVTAAALALLMASAQAVEVAVDAGLEDAGINGIPQNPDPQVVGWNCFPQSGANTCGTTTENVFAGQHSGQLTTNALASANLLKHGFVGQGVVAPDSAITVSFWARGTGEIGGVAFAELFSEIAGGGVSASEILGGAPLQAQGLSADWTQFTFMTTTGSDVSGGVTVQFNAATGGADGSFSELFIDNLSIDVTPIPVPAAVWLFGSALGLLGWVRRNGR